MKFVACNADEGDSGTFADRMLIEGDPFTLIEGMTIAAYAVGADEGYIYLRSEYPAVERCARHRRRLRPRLARRDVLGSGLAFDLHVRVGAGAYICGEETSMLESLEGKRGEVRAKPPIPAIEGLFGQPTVVNNVLTLSRGPMILADGGAAYAALGSGRSRGTRSSSSPATSPGGIVETAFGVTLRELVEDFGGGTRPAGRCGPCRSAGRWAPTCPRTAFDLPMDYEALAEVGAMLGHGGIVVFDDTVDMARMARFAMEFCAIESCGKCTPCRIGSVRGVETIDRIIAGTDGERNLVLLDDLCATMTKGSLCAMGGLTPMPVQSAIRHFAETSTEDPMTTSHESATDASYERTRTPPRRTTAPRGRRRGSAHVTIDGIASTCPPGPRSFARPRRRASRSPSCAPPTPSRPSGRVGSAWSRSRAARGRRPRARRPASTAWSCRTQTEQVRDLRRGVMELYLSDHPIDCPGCARGNCEMQGLARQVGVAEVRYGLDGANHLSDPGRRLEPVLRL